MRYVRIICNRPIPCYTHFLLLSLRQKIKKNLSSLLSLSLYSLQISRDWAEGTLDPEEKKEVIDYLIFMMPSKPWKEKMESHMPK